jgi:hypothetical protein
MATVGHPPNSRVIDTISSHRTASSKSPQSIVVASREEPQAQPFDPGIRSGVTSYSSQRAFTKLDTPSASRPAILSWAAMPSDQRAALPCPECTGEKTERIPLRFESVLVTVYSCLECGHIWRDPEPAHSRQRDHTRTER